MRKEPEAPKPDPRSGDTAVLALAEGLLSAMGKAATPADLRTLRDVAESYPDDGHDGAGEVVTSLVGLLDDLLATGQFDREALAVHVRAWRFMVACKPGGQEQSALMSGLQSVRELYASPKAA
jgi:hypothetical protein